MKTFQEHLITEGSGFDKDVHVSYYEKYPEYTGGGWFTDVVKFNDYLMDPTSYYHRRAVRSPQHPITGKKELQFKMKDKRMGEPAFARLYKIAINAPMDGELIALVKAAKLRKKV